MDAHLPIPRLQLFERKGIIIILSIFGVNGDGKDISEIPALFIFIVGDFPWDAFSIFFNFSRKCQGKVMFGQNGLHLNIMLPGITENIRNLSKWVFRMLRPFSNACNSLLAVTGPLKLIQGYEYIYRHVPAVGNKECKLFCNLHNADILFLCPFLDLNDTPFRLFIFSFREEPNLYNIPV